MRVLTPAVSSTLFVPRGSAKFKAAELESEGRRVTQVLLSASHALGRGGRMLLSCRGVLPSPLK